MVFPAHAGMFPTLTHGLTQLGGFPRARGDVPSLASSGSSGATFSPRTRGCSRCGTAPHQRCEVFPAHAGMFPPSGQPKAAVDGFPRARGDVPPKTQVETPPFQFSPRTRGCSLPILGVDSPPVVFPAHAGMFRRLRGVAGQRWCFPRARGDVPPRKIGLGYSTGFSPRTRGCSPGEILPQPIIRVFPAHAGMFR